MIMIVNIVAMYICIYVKKILHKIVQLTQHILSYALFAKKESLCFIIKVCIIESS